jgi:glutathione S-transferase
MAEYIEVADAIPLPGLRVVLTPSVPGPFSEAAKGILHVKKLPYVKARQDILGPNPDLLRWTGQTTAPVACWNDEPPRCTWLDQLFLFERLAPSPPLIPRDWDARTAMFGLCIELMSENGFTWNRRHLMVRDFTRPEHPASTRAVYEKLGQKYWYGPEAAAAAPQRCAEVMQQLDAQLQRQAQRGSRYFIGDALSALDIYWATAAGMLEPLPDALCRMPEMFRAVYTNTDPVLAAATTPRLMAHRDFIYREYLELPVDL